MNPVNPASLQPRPWTIYEDVRSICVVDAVGEIVATFPGKQRWADAPHAVTLVRAEYQLDAARAAANLLVEVANGQ